MPLYAYKCSRCNLAADYFLPVEHDLPRHCKRAMVRIWTAPGIAFKGEGFTRGHHQVELSDGRRGTVGDYGFEQIRKIDPEARLIKA